MNKVYILFKFHYKLSAITFTRLNLNSTNNVERLAEGIKNYAEIQLSLTNSKCISDVMKATAVLTFDRWKL